MNEAYKGIHKEQPKDWFDQIFKDMQKFFPDKQPYRGPFIQPKPPVHINTTGKSLTDIDDKEFERVLKEWNSNSRIVFEETPRIAKCVPYQVCPMCHGHGQIPSRLATTTNTHELCPVCNGSLIIPMCVLNEEQNTTI